MAGEFLELYAGRDKAVLGKVTRRFMRIIETSFVENAMRDGGIPRAELKRRFEILEKWFRTLHNLRTWSLERILDNLQHALRAELNGGTWDPSQVRRVWAPEEPSIMLPR